ncbi:MAG: hypothetical protein ABI779_03755 [Acidobacteriota bacterium]
MRTFLTILCILVVAIGALAVYLVVTTPKEAAPLRFPLTDSQAALLAHVPSDAEAYALIPTPAVLLTKLAANPITRETVTRWTGEQALPPASTLGRAEAVVWKRGKITSYAVRLDPVRFLIVRGWTWFSDVDSQWMGRTLIINGGEHVPSAPPVEIGLAALLPPGDAVVVQRQESKGAFPPIGRPALSSVSVSERQIEITSRAAVGKTPEATRPDVRATLPRSALLAVAFSEPPRVLGDLDRLVAADIEALVGGGGTLALYRVDTGTLLPRPFMAIGVPANEQTRATVARYDNLLDLMGQKAEQGGELVISFDRSTASEYLKDARAPLPWPANRWALRLDPPRLIPILRKVGDNPALRFATPRIHRGARDLRRWMGALEQASSVEAASSIHGDQEELRLRISAK